MENRLSECDRCDARKTGKAALYFCMVLGVLMAGEVKAQSEHLEAVALLNGKAKAEIRVRYLNSGLVLHTDEFNPVQAKAREAFVEQVPTLYADEVRDLLSDLADDITEERARQQEAKNQNADDPFPEIVPWDHSVDGEQLLDDLVTFISSYMVMASHETLAVTLWIVHTYVLEVSDYTPYLLVTSPVRECGKTTLLELLLHVAHRAQMTGGITAAALYRRIDKHYPTMLLDELDTRLRGDSGEALRGVLNTGFQRSGKVTICVGDQHDDKDFSTFCPKVLAGIGRVWDTVTSRSIPLRLSRATKAELSGLTKIRGDRIAQTCLPYRRRLLRWAHDNRAVLRDMDTEAPEELGARQSDVWRPLLAIADRVGGKWPELARQSALSLHKVAEDEGDYALLALQDVREIFENRENPKVMFSATLIEEMVKKEDRPWPEFRHGQPLSPPALAKLIGRFGVKPRQVREGTRSTDEQKRGYTLAELEPVFKKYLPALHDLHPSHPSHDADDDRGEAWEPPELPLEGAA